MIIKISKFIFSTILLFLALISFWGGLVYRIYKLNWPGLIISLILATISLIIIQYFYKFNKPINDNSKKLTIKQSIYSSLLLIAYVLLIIFSFYILYSSRSAAALISPWQVTPWYFFILYGLATLLLTYFTGRQWKFSLFLISLHYFLSFSVIIFIYQIGYGFDSYIHQATLELIDKNGSVEPKTFYYLGQYGLITIIHKLTNISIFWLDKLLVPLLAALTVPLFLYRALGQWFESKSINKLQILVLLILPFSLFTFTTPQNFAYLLLVLVILYGLMAKNIYDLIIIFLLSAITLMTQLIAGVPALLFTVILTIHHSDIRINYKKLFYFIISIATVFALPLAFYILQKNSIASSVEPPNGLTNIIYPLLPGQENFILNFVYFYGFNLKFIISFLIIAGIFICWRWRRQCGLFYLYLLLAIASLLAYFLSLKLPFNFLITYERQDYANRLLTVAVLFLLPFIFSTLDFIIYKISRQNKIIKFTWLFFICLLVMASLYLSYPRLDKYFNSRGYSTSQNDITAVNWVNQDASGQNYIVLANQQVSAASLHQFGFAKYFNTTQGPPVFYYPIPTASPLYQYYLDMVYKKPNRVTMNAAMNLAGVNIGYFILNKYWWNFVKILDQAKVEADNWQTVGQGEVYIFKFIK